MGLFICHIQFEFVAELLYLFPQQWLPYGCSSNGPVWVVQWPGHTSKTISNGLGSCVKGTIYKSVAGYGKHRRLVQCPWAGTWGDATPSGPKANLEEGLVERAF